MNISALMDEKSISFDVSLKDKESVFDYLIQQLYETGVIDSKIRFKEAVMYRETLSETGLGDGIAIPHGKTTAVKKAGIAFVRLKSPIEWPSLDDKPIQYVFLLAIPEGSENQEHIKMISELARSLIKDDVIEAIKNADNAQRLLETF